MTITIQHVLGAFQGNLGLNMRIMREIYGVRSLELIPQQNSLLSYLPPEQTVSAPLRLNCDNSISPYTMIASCWQPEEFSFVRQIAATQSRFVLIDIGANVGLFSRQCLANLPNCVRAYAYEPDPQNYGLLEFNLAPFGHVESACVALSDTEGESVYFLDPDNSGNYSLNVAAMPDEHRTGKLQCIDTRTQSKRWLADGVPIFYKSDTQGFDEKIASCVDDCVWDSVIGGIIEVWQIAKPQYDAERFRIVLDKFPHKRFLTEPQVPLSTVQVLDFLAGTEGKSGDLGFWK